MRTTPDGICWVMFKVPPLPDAKGVAITGFSFPKETHLFSLRQRMVKGLVIPPIEALLDFGVMGTVLSVDQPIRFWPGDD